MKRERSEDEVFRVPEGVRGPVQALAVRIGGRLVPGTTVCRVGDTAVVFGGEDEAVVTALETRETAVAGPGDTLFLFRVCRHAFVVHGLCTSCALPVEVDKRVQLMPSQPEFFFNRDTAELVAARAKARLLATRKLSLVLDLDLTLLHATHDRRHGQVLLHGPEEDTRDIHMFQMGAGSMHWVKLRPGLDEFLERAHTKFEMHIFTHGSKEYGHKIASIIDPTGAYFSPQEGIGEKRITCMDDAYGEQERLELRSRGARDYKRLDRLFPVSSEQVLVLDDNSVWGTSPNVLRVIPYIFWNDRLPKQVTGELVANQEMPPPSTLPINFLYKTEAAHETHLQELMYILERVHTLYYEKPDQTCARLFAQARGEILQGCVAVFTGVYSKEIDAADMPLTTLLIDYGGEHRASIGAGVTHIIASHDGTDKVRQGRTAGLKVVHVDWLIDSIRHFRRMNESDYETLPKERQSISRGMNALLRELVGAYLNYDDKKADEEGEEAEIDMDEMMMLMEAASDDNDDDDDNNDNE